MIRKAIVILFLTVFVVACQAQRSSNQGKGFNHELGFNTTLLLRKIFGIELVSTDYDIKYRYNFNKAALQLGIQTDFSDRTRQLNNDEEQVNRAFVLRTKAGFVWNLPFGEKWRSYLGVEGIYNIRDLQTNQTSTSGEVRSKVETNEFGGGPVMGIVFQLNERINLSTEMAFHAIYSETLNSQEFFTFPEFNQTTLEKRYRAVSVLPSNIYFEFRF